MVGAQISLPAPQQATEAALLQALPQLPPEVEIKRTIEASFCTHNIGAVPDFSNKSRIMDFVGKLQLLAGRYKARKLHLVGIQETRSRTRHELSAPGRGLPPHCTKHRRTGTRRC